MSRFLSHKFGSSLLLLVALFMTSCAAPSVPGGSNTGTPAGGAPTAAPRPTATVAAAPTAVSATPTGAPAATPVPTVGSTVRIAVQAPDNSVKLIGVDSQGTQLAAAGVAFEFGRPENAIAGTIYAGSSNPPAGVYAIDAKGARRLDFIPPSGHGWAANSRGTPMLAWGVGTLGPTSTVEIVAAAPDGSNRRSLVREPVSGEPRVLRPLQFSTDGQSLYFGKEPVGLGGYILFGGLSNVWSVNLGDAKTTELFSEKRAGGTACVDGLAGTQVATHCDRQSIQVFDLANSSQPARIIRPPSGVTFTQLGGAAFNPAGTRVAFALARGDASNEHGWLLVSDGLSGGSKVVGESRPNEYFNALAWLDEELLVVQSLSTAAGAPTGAVWLARANGGALTKLADGTFLALSPTAPR